MSKQGDLRCICCSGRSFSECCEPFLAGKNTPKTAKQLMRSRYAAYALGGHGEYLRKTCHPASAGKSTVADLDGSDYTWTGLEIINSSQKGDVAQVEFRAVYLDEAGVERCHHEISTFLRQQGQWFYFDAVFPDSDDVSEQRKP